MLIEFSDVKVVGQQLVIGKISYQVKGVKTEWVQVWANSIHFAIYAVKSKQTYQTSKTITVTW